MLKFVHYVWYVYVRDVSRRLNAAAMLSFVFKVESPRV